MKQPRDYALMLLRKAASDLIAADAIMQTGKALDTVGFHAQQATEKSLKAILSFHGVEETLVMLGQVRETADGRYTTG